MWLKDEADEDIKMRLEEMMGNLIDLGFIPLEGRHVLGHHYYYDAEGIAVAHVLVIEDGVDHLSVRGSA